MSKTVFENARTQLFHSAIVNADGTVNIGYLTLFRLLRMLFIVVTVECLLAVFGAWIKPDKTVDIIQALGIAVGATCGGGFGAALAACGVFLWGDSHTASARVPADGAPPPGQFVIPTGILAEGPSPEAAADKAAVAKKGAK